MQFFAILQKELLQLWRNKQIIWVPLAFMLIAIIDAITYYYLPEILEYSGELPEGAIIEVPTLTSNDAIIMGVEQLGLLGSLLIIAITMGTISAERNSGIAELLYGKPIKPHYYISSKWVAFTMLTLFSLLFAFLLNWYYTAILYGDTQFSLYIKAYLFFSLWFMFIIALSLFFNSFLRSPGLVLALTLVVIFLLSLVKTLFGHKLHYLPNQITDYIVKMVQTNTIDDSLYITSGVAIALIIFILFIASILFKHNKM